MPAIIVGLPYFAFYALPDSDGTLHGARLVGFLVLVPLLVAACGVTAWLSLRLFIAPLLAAIGDSGPLAASFRLTQGVAWDVFAVIVVFGVPLIVIELFAALALAGQFSLKPVNPTFAFTVYDHISRCVFDLIISGGAVAAIARDRLGRTGPHSTPNEQRVRSALAGA